MPAGVASNQRAQLICCCFDLLWISSGMRSSAARLQAVHYNLIPEPVVPHTDETQRMWPPAALEIRAMIPQPSRATLH
jgi:hypothetical protein